MQFLLFLDSRRYNGSLKDVQNRLNLKEPGPPSFILFLQVMVSRLVLRWGLRLLVYFVKVVPVSSKVTRKGLLQPRAASGASGGWERALAAQKLYNQLEHCFKRFAFATFWKRWSWKTKEFSYHQTTHWSWVGRSIKGRSFLVDISGFNPFRGILLFWGGSLRFRNRHLFQLRCFWELI